MSVSPLNAAPAPIAAKTPERLEGPGPDHDGDKDDKGISVAPSSPTQTAPAGHTGTVNKTV